MMSTEQRYKFHRMARYLLAVPMVFLLDWWAAALILAVLPFEDALRIAVFAAIFAILACAAGFCHASRRGIFGASVRLAGVWLLLSLRPFVCSFS